MKKITLTARRHIINIADFIEQGSPAKSIEYADAVENLFYGLQDNVTFKRASERLPKNVREIMIDGFRGYTLRIMRHSDGVTYLLSAHRPGLTEAMKNRQTRVGINEVKG